MAAILNLNTNISFKRGSTAANNAYTGPVGTISIDIENKEIRYHDGVTPGGYLVNQNVQTAAKLKTARTINGVGFDGSSNITIFDNTKLSLSGGTLTDFVTLHADPTSAMHPATKQYVDNVASGLGPKLSVLASTTANITLSGLQTIDGVAITNGQRVLVKNQTNTAENGIYIAGTGTWVRANDANSWSELISAYVFIEKGSVNGDTGWICLVDQGGVLGSTAVTWSQFNGSGSVTAGTGISVAGNVISLSPVGSLASGLYKMTVDNYGRVVAGTTVTSSDILSYITNGTIANNMLANAAVASLSGSNTGDETAASIRSKLGISTLSGTNTGDQTITLTGDVTGSGTGTFATALKASGVTAGEYTKVTVNSKGIVTSGTGMNSADVATALNDVILDLGTL